MSSQGAPIAGARIVMMIHLEHGWRRDWSCHEVTAKTTDQGRFELRGKLQNRKPGLAAELDGWTCLEVAPFEVGARDVKVTLVQAGTIEGSISGLGNPDPRVWVDAPVGVSVVKAGTKPPRTAYDSAPMDTDRREVDVFEGKFEARSLLPGTYSVEFYAKSRTPGDTSGEPLLVVNDVVVRPGEVTRDPRLQNISLSKLLKSRVVTVLDEQGRPLKNVVIGARPAGESGEFLNFTTGPDGKSVVATPDATVDLVVALKGYRAETIADVSADATVTLRKASVKRVTVRLPADVEIPPPPFYLGVSLQWIGAAKLSDGFEWSDPRNRDAETVFFGADRIAVIEVDTPGTYAATVWLNERHASGGSGISISDETRATFEVGEEGGASVTVNVDPEEVKKTVASRKKRQ